MLAVIAAAWSLAFTFTPPTTDNLGTCAHPINVTPVIRADSVMAHWRCWAIQDVFPVSVPSWRPIEDSAMVARGVTKRVTVPVVRDTANYWGIWVWCSQVPPASINAKRVAGCIRNKVITPFRWGTP